MTATAPVIPGEFFLQNDAMLKFPRDFVKAPRSCFQQTPAQSWRGGCPGVVPRPLAALKLGQGFSLSPGLDRPPACPQLCPLLHTAFPEWNFHPITSEPEPVGWAWACHPGSLIWTPKPFLPSLSHGMFQAQEQLRSGQEFPTDHLLLKLLGEIPGALE